MHATFFDAYKFSVYNHVQIIYVLYVNIWTHVFVYYISYIKYFLNISIQTLGKGRIVYVSLNILMSLEEKSPSCTFSSMKQQISGVICLHTSTPWNIPSPDCTVWNKYIKYSKLAILRTLNKCFRLHRCNATSWRNFTYL